MQYCALSRARHSKGQLLASEVPSLLLHAVCSATRVRLSFARKAQAPEQTGSAAVERCTNIICLSESKLSVSSRARTCNPSLKRIVP